MKLEVIENIDNVGLKIYYERYETSLSLSAFDYGSKYKMLCKACPKFGKNLACPPYSPNFLEYIEDAATANVICIRLPIEYFNHSIPEERYGICFRKAKSLLIEELLEFRQKGQIVAGAGFCLACKHCEVETGKKECKKPKEKIYSLESLGVNIGALVESCFNFNLEWSNSDHIANFVCAIGAVFFNKDNGFYE